MFQTWMFVSPVLFPMPALEPFTSAGDEPELPSLKHGCGLKSSLSSPGPTVAAVCISPRDLCPITKWGSLFNLSPCGPEQWPRASLWAGLGRVCQDWTLFYIRSKPHSWIRPHVVSAGLQTPRSCVHETGMCAQHFKDG